MRAWSFLANLLLAASSLASAASDDTIPMQVRLAYAGQTGMVVSWNTYSQLERPTVYYGTIPDDLRYFAYSDVSVTYPTSTTYNNHVNITGLQPDTLYYYLPQDLSSEPYTFRTARAAGDMTPYSIAVVADLGTMGPDGLTTYVGNGAANPLAPGEKNTIQSLADTKHGWEFLLHLGDIAYADYWLKEEIQDFLPNTTIEGGIAVYERILNEFYDEMTVVTVDRPYMVAPGNHEANCDNGGTTDPVHDITYDVSICVPGQTNFTGYINHFRMPSSESGGLGNFWYSFDHGMVHYIVMDTETDLGHGFIGADEPGGTEGDDAGPFSTIMNAQTDWLQKDLASVDRSKTPWIIAGGHHPWYVSFPNGTGDVCLMCQDVFEPLLVQYKVDLVLTGHVHVYERNEPMNFYAVDPAGLHNPKAPWFITNGVGGHYDGLDVLSTPLPYYSVYAQDTSYGYSRITFHNCTHMTHEFVASGNGTVLDSATLFKDRKCAENSQGQNQNGNGGDGNSQ